MIRNLGMFHVLVCHYGYKKTDLARLKYFFSEKKMYSQVQNYIALQELAQCFRILSWAYLSNL